MSFQLPVVPYSQGVILPVLRPLPSECSRVGLTNSLKYSNKKSNRGQWVCLNAQKRFNLNIAASLHRHGGNAQLALTDSFLTKDLSKAFGNVYICLLASNCDTPYFHSYHCQCMTAPCVAACKCAFPRILSRQCYLGMCKRTPTLLLFRITTINSTSLISLARTHRIKAIALVQGDF